MSAPATLDRAGIARRIPHAGRMALLDTLVDWSSLAVHCTATGHDAVDHPLRSASGLLAPAAIEYAAQAMALHGALIAPAGAAPSAGYLVSVRGVHFAVPALDGLPGPLHVRAQHLAGAGQQIQYRFSLHDGLGAPVAEGRATVVLNTPLNLAPAARETPA